MSSIKRGSMSKPVVDFGAGIAGKLLGSNASALPRPVQRILKTDQINDPGDTERPRSFYEGFEELKAAMKAFSLMDADGVGNHHNIVLIGTGTGPFEVVAGRRRYAAAKALKLPIRANVYAALTEEQRDLVHETENSARTSLAPSELVAKLVNKYQDGNGMTFEKLALAFAMGDSTIRLYLGFAQDKTLLAELDRGLSIREARRMQAEHGDEAGRTIAARRQNDGAEIHSKPRTGRKAWDDVKAKPVLDARIAEGKKTIIVFNEKRAKVRDFEKYHEALSTERERIGKIIKARERRQ